MFDSLSDKLQEIIRKTSGTDKLTEDNMSDALREIRRALLEADVNLRVVKAFVAAIRERAEGEKVVQGVDPAQQLIKIVNDELVKLLGSQNAPLKLDGHPSVIMMLGLQGSGKTTSSAKLAVKLKKEGKKPLLVACDVYRPAAIAQLKTLGQQTQTEVFTIEGSNDVQKIATEAIEYAKNNGFNVVILDTAGRLQIDTQMMAELLILDRTIHPQEKLLVIDAMTGQEAVNVAENFNAQLEITGLVLTKLDGDSRGGAALSVKAVTGKPIFYAGMGEKLSDLEQFYPDRMANRILGMGDVLTLIEKAQESMDIDEEKEKQMAAKMKKGKFDFEDYLESMKQMRKMGGLSSILSMMPGMGISGADLEGAIDEKQMARMEAIVLSMTVEERQNPKLLNPSRKHRIAKGAGVDIAVVNRFIKQFEQSQKMMKQLPGMMGGKKGRRGFGGFGGMKLPF